MLIERKVIYEENKKILSVLCVLAVLLSYLDGSIIWSAYAENTETENTEAKKTEAAKELSAPQNLHEENGFIIWDVTPDAYGYSVKACRDDLEINTVYYTNSVELKRFFYENNMEFGEYTFEVCAFHETNTMSEYSNQVTAVYAPTLDTPANVRLSEDGKNILWDEVTGSVLYKVCIIPSEEKEEHKHTQDWYSSNWVSDNSISLNGYLWNFPTGDYYIAIRAMDKDYNISEWTEYTLVTYIAKPRIDTPKNIRLDESGENILWDEVEGADYYVIQVYSSSDYLEYSGGTSYVISKPCYNNWKSITIPFYSKYVFYVYAASYDEEYEISEDSDALTVNFTQLHDESINVPDNIWLEDDKVQWNEVEGANRYYLRLSVKGRHIDNVCSSDNYVFSQIFEYIPAGDYEAELFVVDENNHYNSKSYSLTLNTAHDETVWIPDMFYKFETLLWDYDELRHDETDSFWIRIKKDNDIVCLERVWQGKYEGLLNLSNGDYEVQVCTYEYTGKIGKWSEPLKIRKHEGGLFDKENEVSTEVEPSPDAGQIPEEDRITTITINPAFNMKNKHDNNVEIDLSKIKIKAKEIYDEEGLKRASEALGEKIAGNKHYNLLDLTLFEGDRDISNGYEGLVQVIIPLPKGHRNKKFSCYRLTEVNGKMTKEEIPGEQTEDSYIIYLEHFSEYALIADEHTHDYGESWKSNKNSHWKECECSARSEEEEHIYGDWKIVREATESEEGVKERNCEKCGYKMTETIPKKSYTHIHDYEEICKFDENSHWKECECGDKSEESEHTYEAWKIIREATENEEGIRERVCNVCGYKQTGNLPKLIVSTPSEPNKFDDRPNEKPDDKLKEIPEPDNQNPDTGDCVLDTSYSVLLICCAVITLLARKRSLKEKYTNK